MACVAPSHLRSNLAKARERAEVTRGEEITCSKALRLTEGTRSSRWKARPWERWGL
jgi:hypothetical protein